MLSLWRMRSKRICRIDMTAFAAVLFVLMFAVAIYDVLRIPPHVDSSWLPKASHATAMHRALREDALRVAVTRDGSVFFGSEQSGMGEMDKVSPEELQRQLSQRISAGAERKVYILTDADARYGAVMPVLNIVRNAGIENVAFMVQESEHPQ